jgi:glycerophosphoryl diester phosphodiesterase
MQSLRKNLRAGTPSVIAHRGASSDAPENTLASFRLGLDRGADFLEADLHLSRDGHWVAIHDATLERTTSGRGPVSGFSFEQLRRMDAGAWYATQFAGQQIPAPEELLECAAGSGAGFYLEIKCRPDDTALANLSAAVRGARMAERTVVMCFDAEVLARMRHADREITTGLLFEEFHPDALEQAIALGAAEICPWRGLVNREMVVRAHAAGLGVTSWTANEVDEMNALFDAGVDGIITDYPGRLVELLAG